MYHLGKANRVANALSWKFIASLMSIQGLPSPLQKEINRLEIKLIESQLSTLTLQLTIFGGI